MKQKRIDTRRQLRLVPDDERAPTSAQLARDARAALRAEARALLVRDGVEVAREILAERGRVTSVEVRARMIARGLIHREAPYGLDPRWIGAVFSGLGLVRIGWEPTGSHGRPVAIWIEGGSSRG